MGILGSGQGEGTQRRGLDIHIAARSTSEAGIAARLERTTSYVKRQSKARQFERALGKRRR